MTNRLNQILEKTKLNYPILLIVLGALFLRFYGIHHGMPYIYSVDEPALVRSSLGIWYNLNPGHFDWPHFYYYFNSLILYLMTSARSVINLVGLRDFTEGIYPLLWKDPPMIYMTTRFFVAIFGSFTAFAVYKIAKEITNKKNAYLAAIIMATIPFHVLHSKEALADIPLVFFMSWIVYFSIRIAKQGKLKDYALAGLFLGLATSTKYNGLLLVINILLAHFITLFQSKTYKIQDILNKNIIIAGIVTIVTFILTTPFAVLDYSTFLRANSSTGALWQFKNVGSVSFNQYLIELYNNLFTKLPQNIGAFMWILFIVCLVVVLIKYIKYQKLTLLLIVFPILYFIYVSKFQRQPPHYFLPIYPFISLVIMYVLEKSKGYVKKFLYLALALALVINIYSSLLIAKIDSTIDTRNLASNWMDKTLVSGNSVFLDGEYSPLNLNGQVRSFTTKSQVTKEFILENNPDYIIVSRYNNEQGLSFSYLQDLQISEVEFIDGTNNRGPNITIYQLLKN